MLPANATSLFCWYPLGIKHKLCIIMYIVVFCDVLNYPVLCYDILLMPHIEWIPFASCYVLFCLVLFCLVLFCFAIFCSALTHGLA